MKFSAHFYIMSNYGHSKERYMDSSMLFWEEFNGLSYAVI